MKPSPALLPLLALAFASCSTEPPAKPDIGSEEKQEFGATGIPAHLRHGGPVVGTRVEPGGNARDISKIKLTPLDQLIITKADINAEQPQELADLLANASAARSKTWERSDTIARSRSLREGKPVLIYFADPANDVAGGLGRVLEQELFADPKFEAWASEKLVRLKVDMTYRPNDPDMSIDEADTMRSTVKSYSQTLKKRYKVMGFPTLVMVGADGTVIGRYSGFRRGTAPFVWGQLKHAESVSSRAYGEWRKGMEKQGYREWQDRRGRKVFAKLANYHEGELILIDPEGTRSRTQEDKLSDADRDWIATQKKLRGIQ